MSVTGGERIDLEAGRYLGTLSPMNQKSLEVSLITLDPLAEAGTKVR